MPVEKTQVDAVIPDDLEDTFRSGPPSSLPPAPRIEDEADTGEMLAAVETSDVLDDAGPTAKTPKPKLGLKLPRPNTLPPQAHAQPQPRPQPQPQKRAQRTYDPFSLEDPPAVGVDPAVFPILRTAPRSNLGQKIILALVGTLMTLVVTAFVLGGESTEARAVRLAREERFAVNAMQQEQIRARAQELATRRLDPAAPQQRAAPSERRARIRAAKQAIAERRRKGGRQRRLERAPYQFTDGKVAQPQNYGGQAEHVPPPDTKRLMILRTVPQSLVYRDRKLFGATPMILPMK
jgi:hypothetical protein